MQRASPAVPSIPDLAAATPRDRDRFLDLLRAGSIVVVVAGHWLMAAAVRDAAGVPRADNALGYVRWLQPVTWVLQVMPVFFLVGGFANARALSRPGASAARFWSGRARRLLPATLLFAAAWLVVAAVLTAAPLPDRTVRDVGRVVAQPLWFLAVYVLLILVAPVQLRLHHRLGWRSLALLVVLAAALDACRLTGLSTGVAIANYLVVFMFAQELGFWYADGRLVGLSGRWLLAGAAVAIASLALLTTVGPYPVSMVGVPGEELSNMSPPTVCVLVVTVAQVCLLLAARPMLLRWLQRPWPWRLTVTINLAVLTIFLWHLTAYVAASAMLTGLGVPLDIPGTAGWWVAKGATMLVAAVLLTLLVLAAMPVERLTSGRGRVPRNAGRCLLGTLLAGVGLAALAASGFTDPFDAGGRALVGVRFSPVSAVVLLAAGLLLASPPLIPREQRDQKPGD